MLNISIRPTRGRSAGSASRTSAASAPSAMSIPAAVSALYMLKRPMRGRVTCLLVSLYLTVNEIPFPATEASVKVSAGTMPSPASPKVRTFRPSASRRLVNLRPTESSWLMTGRF